MKVLHYIYNGETIDFSTAENIMINATQMAKLYDKRTDVFLKSDDTKKFIEALEKHIQKENKLTPNGGSLAKKCVDFRGRNGVFFERRLALKFAGWLNVDFELWIYDTIDKILLGYYKDHRSVTIEKLQLEKEREAKEKELLEKYPSEFLEFIQISDKISDAEKKRSKIMREQMKQLKLNFNLDGSE